THNNFVNFKKSIDWANKNGVQMILHCGDIQTQQIIDESKEAFNGEIKFAKGNGDYDLDLPEKMELEVDSKKIAFCHFPEIAKKLAASGKLDIVFYGHTHKPWEEIVNNCRLVNPGELAGQLFKPTFAVYDTMTNLLELKILDNLK
ncbi:MAG TPA: YfcE family phosphodiesterase, partial [Candidatus Staskawiczbacteria bacterium]|nr:YfcE family phosphodiesterase [Candidatus Staskawiczbacteria bacterium]